MIICTIRQQYYTEEINWEDNTVKLDGTYTLEELEKIVFCIKYQEYINKNI
jgi:hypothetical protein